MNTTKTEIIPAGASPGITRHHPDGVTMDTEPSCNSGVHPRIRQPTGSYVQSNDQRFQYQNADLLAQVRPCSIQLDDILNFTNFEQHCVIKKCKQKNCKTCNILITEPSFTSNLTGKSYNTRSHDELNCTSANIVYGLECNLCGLIYVGETKGRLNVRMNGHRSGINTSKLPEVYQHFNQPDHSILSMRVRILEKIYHPTNNPNLSTPLRRQKEEYWIRKLGTAIPYGCNDKIDSIGNLSSPRCEDVNVMNIFEYSPRRTRSHGKRHYKPPNFHDDVSLDDLLPFLNKPLGLHHIRTKLYSLPRNKLHILFKSCLDTPVTDQHSSLYRLQAVVLDICNHRLFKQVTTFAEPEEATHFLPLQFANKGLDAINLANILHHKSVKEKIPANFKDKSVPKISYTYTTPIAPRIFNYKKVLQDLEIDDFKAKPPDCSCANSPFKYGPSGHIITGDLNIVQNKSLRDVLSKGPKYREPRSINWNYNFKLLMDAVEDYARKWVKREQADEVDSLSEWIKAVRSLIQLRIKKLRRSMNTKATSIFKNPDVAETLSSIHDQYVVVPADKAPNNIVFICKKHYIECLITELGIDGTGGNPTYTASTLSRDEIIDNHLSVLSSFGINDFYLVKMIVIFPLCIGYLNSTKVHTNSAILLGLPNVPPNLCQCY